MGASGKPDRAGALRAEPAAQSQAKPLIPSAAYAADVGGRNASHAIAQAPAQAVSAATPEVAADEVMAGVVSSGQAPAPATQGRLLAAGTPADYRGWSVEWDYGQYWATSPDYDASWEGEEDGWVDNGLRTSARTLPDLHAEVDAILEERGRRSRCAPRPSAMNTHTRITPETEAERAERLAEEAWEQLRAERFDEFIEWQRADYDRREFDDFSNWLVSKASWNRPNAYYEACNWHERALADLGQIAKGHRAFVRQERG